MPEAPPSPIVLTGTVRAGTTLLARILGRHPRICYLGFELSERWSAAGVPIASVETDDVRCPGLGADAATVEMRQSMRAAIAVEMPAEADDTRPLLKNPHLANKLPLVHALFPDAALVVVSRDLRSTVASTRRLWESVDAEYDRRHALPDAADEAGGACWSCLPSGVAAEVEPGRVFPGGDVAVIAEYWLRTYAAIDAHWRLFPRRVAVRHRDLVTDPARTLAGITDALGLDGGPWDPGEALDASRNDCWRQILTADERRRVDEFVIQQRERIAALSVADKTGA